MAYVCYLVVLRYSDGSGFRVIGESTENFTEACVARDAASEAAGDEGMVIAFETQQDAQDFKATKG